MVETTSYWYYIGFINRKLIERKDLLPEINILRLRIRHGVKLELIPLIQLEELEESGQGLYIGQESQM